MGRPRKPAAPPRDIIGAVLADNITHRLAAAFPRAANETAQLDQLKRRSGVAKETIRRILRCEVSPRLDIVDAIARALGTSAADLISTHHQTPQQKSAPHGSTGEQPSLHRGTG